MSIMNQDLLRDGSKQLGIELTSSQMGKFQEYFNLLVKWNKTMNLTAIKDADEIVLKHFLDSLTLVPYLKTPAKIIDIGTGAGFPGIPLKIALPALDITLVDSTAKKIGFLELIIRNLKLEKCSAVHSRAEDLINLADYQENFDFITARALASLAELFPLLKPFARKGSKIILLKGAEAENEVADFNQSAGFDIEIIPLKVPGLEAKRNLIQLSFR